MYDTPLVLPAGCLSFLSTSIITAMYAIIPQQIPQGKRAEINEKIHFAINSGKDMIPAESIYNCYTDIGYTPETEVLLEKERQDVIIVHQAWQAKQVQTA